MMAAVSCAASSRKSTANIFAPSRAYSTAAALPLPQPGPDEPAPMTMTTFPFMRSDMISSMMYRVSGPHTMQAPSEAGCGSGCQGSFGGRRRSSAFGVLFENSGAGRAQRREILMRNEIRPGRFGDRIRYGRQRQINDAPRIRRDVAG